MGPKNFFWGAVFGGVAALLFAPKAGKELREDLANKYRDVSKRGDKIAGHISNRAEDLFEQAKLLASDTKEAATFILNEIQKEEKKSTNTKRRRK